MKYKILIYGTIICQCLVLSSILFNSCCDTCGTEKKIGVVVEATVVPTSFNESIKVQVRTNDKFFVVYGLPQLNIGDSITARMDGDGVSEIMDCRGKWFDVY